MRLWMILSNNSAAGVKRLSPTAKTACLVPARPSSTSCGRKYFGSSSTSKTIPAEQQIPTPKQLRLVALRAAVPMVGFGFMDNLVMIQAGEAIDMSIGVAFGLSTMTAAGFGQCVSDVAGFTTGGAVDAAVARLNLPQHGLSPTQLDMKISRMYNTAGGCVGVVTGCLLGMSCLLFMDTEKAERAKKSKELQTIFETVMREGSALVGAEASSLWFLDEEKGILWTRVATGRNGIIEVPLGIPVKAGLVSSCIASGEILNIADAYQDKRFDTSIDQNTGYRTTSVLCVPVRREDGKVYGAIQMINKKRSDGSISSFDANDEKLMQMLASHVSAFTRIVQGGV